MRKKFFSLKIFNNSGISPIESGFTLIELMTVIAVIGIVSTIGLNSYIGIQRKARDATRKSHLQQIRVALELYRSDVGSYPASLPGCNSPLVNGSNTYMQRVPCDPQGLNGGNYGYVSGYTLTSCLENNTDPQGESGASVPGCTSGRRYRVTNP